MEKKKFKEILKKEKPEDIISDYMKCNIYLTDKQLKTVIDEKNKDAKNEGHGAVCFDYRKG